MTARTASRGHPIAFDATSATWRYADTGDPVAGEERPCAACGLVAEPGGPDPCLGIIPGAIAACCGHGITPGYVMRASPPSEGHEP